MKTLRFQKWTNKSKGTNNLLKETLLRALDKKAKCTTFTLMKKWMYALMYNLFINNYSKVIQYNTLEEYDLKDIHNAVCKFPEEYRIPFTMHLSGFEYSETAERLHLPLGTVKSRIFFIRQSLYKK
ncbi:RNA polymerase sigma factor [uncultured Bacteroides sp.]|uniref:RNA polymerase sigma factor n=1 Tax=uncultured Bacteroides sp. TaxID=162156 RepID=UPI0025D54D73|nr:RNA polymerase sigma factor [uncultured Bacteroides sp.]